VKGIGAWNPRLDRGQIMVLNSGLRSLAAGLKKQLITG